MVITIENIVRTSKVAHLKLAIGPSGDLNYHVQDSLLLIGIQRNVVEGRDWNSILLNGNDNMQKDGLIEKRQSIGRRNLPFKKWDAKCCFPRSTAKHCSLTEN